MNLENFGFSFSKSLSSSSRAKLRGQSMEMSEFEDQDDVLDEPQEHPGHLGRVINDENPGLRIKVEPVLLVEKYSFSGFE